MNEFIAYLWYIVYTLAKMDDRGRDWPLTIKFEKYSYLKSFFYKELYHESWTTRLSFLFLEKEKKSCFFHPFFAAFLTNFCLEKNWGKK